MTSMTNEIKEFDGLNEYETAREIRIKSFVWLRGSKYYDDIVNQSKYGPVVINILRGEIENGRKVEHFNMTPCDLIRTKEYLYRSIENNHKTFTWKRSR